MLKSVIERDIDYKLKITKTGNYISLEGTDVLEIGDILADVLLLVPYYIDGVGFVSYGAYVQAMKVYLDIIDDIKLDRPIYISGHSLGGGIGQILAILLQRFFFTNVKIYISVKGSIKVLSKGAKEYLRSSNIHIVDYSVRYRDLVPHLGWWLEPYHTTERTGNKRKHFLDFDMKEHMGYWK